MLVPHQLRQPTEHRQVHQLDFRCFIRTVNGHDGRRLADRRWSACRRRRGSRLQTPAWTRGESVTLGHVRGAGQAGYPSLETGGEAAAGPHSLPEYFEAFLERLAVVVPDCDEVVLGAVQTLRAGDELAP
jgi:hypothetical protein